MTKPYNIDDERAFMLSLRHKMTKKEAREWIKVYKNAKFKCIAPNQLIEAFRVLGMIKERKVHIEKR